MTTDEQMIARLRDMNRGCNHSFSPVSAPEVEDWLVALPGRVLPTAPDSLEALLRESERILQHKGLAEVLEGSIVIGHIRALDAALRAEKQRADENFASWERVRALYSAAAERERVAREALEKAHAETHRIRTDERTIERARMSLLRLSSKLSTALAAMEKPRP